MKALILLLTSLAAFGQTTTISDSLTATVGGGTWTATIIDANTFSIPVNSVSLGALAGTVIATTTAPRTTQAVWSVQKHVYDGSNNRIWSGFVGGSPSERNTCSAAPTQAQ